MGLEKYQHLRAASFYEHQKVCKNCFLALTKIEAQRRKAMTRAEKLDGMVREESEASFEEELKDESVDLKVSRKSAKGVVPTE